MRILDLMFICLYDKKIDIAIFNQNAITGSSGEMTDFYLATYARFFHHLIYLNSGPFLHVSVKVYYATIEHLWQ